MDSFPEIKKEKLFTRFIGSCKKHIPFCVLILVSLFCIAVYVVSRFSTEFAEFWSVYPGQGVRYVLAMATTLFPFSVSEVLILSIPLLLVTVGYISYRLGQKSSKWFSIMLRTVVSVALVIVCLFCVGFGPCYFRNTLSENLGLTDEAVSADSLYETAMWLTDEINDILPYIQFAKSGESCMRVTLTEIASMVNEAYNDYAASADFISSFTATVKPISLSRYMTYTHLSGLYTYFTGEANFNFNYPDFIIPNTIAHEMSHQRGIAREDEANFMAFLVCISSDYPYIRYSGYVNVLRNVMSALYSADKNLYNEYKNNYYPRELADEMSSYSKFFDKYRESTASKVVSATNDAYLKSQDVKGGVKNYGLVTDLAVAYYLTKIKTD